MSEAERPSWSYEPEYKVRLDEQADGSQRPRTSEEIESWLVDRIAVLAELAKEDVDVQRAFSEFGIDSSVVVTVTHELSQFLGSGLAVTVFWEYPTIRALSKSLAAT
jgi:acyl carrier protein